MTSNAWTETIVFFLLLIVLTPLLGEYCARVAHRHSHHNPVCRSYFIIQTNRNGLW